MFPVDKPTSLEPADYPINKAMCGKKYGDPGIIGAIGLGCSCPNPPLIVPSLTLAPGNTRRYSCGFCGKPMTIQGGIHIIECPCEAGPCKIQFVVDPKGGKYVLHYTCRVKDPTNCRFSEFVWPVPLDDSSSGKAGDGAGGSAP